MKPNNEITEVDLSAYIDEQLDPARRAEVESYLARHRDAAARVMQDLAIRANLKLALGTPSTVPALQTVAHARRLQASFRRGQIYYHFSRIAAILLLLVTGWLARGEIGRFIPESEQAVLPSVLVVDAMRAHEAAQLRSHMHSMPVSTAIDRNEITAATHIVIPDLPDDWRLLDTEVFPSDEGPSVELTIDAGNLGQISLFAVQAQKSATTKPEVVQQGAAAVAFWQEDTRAYALVGTAPKSDLLAAIAKLQPKH
jgi:anti-sigma factor RsiW